MVLITEPRKPWQEVVKEKRALQAKAIAAFAEKYPSQGEAIENILAKRQATVLSNGKGMGLVPAVGIAGPISAADVVSQIERGEASCETVAKTYIQRACETHRLTNCLTETPFDEALSRAKDLDKQGKPLGPLHGVPMTLKDQFDIKGHDSTIGYVGRAFKPAADDSVLVKMLQSLGGVIIAKTNLPQSIMWCETENPLWGLTTNPLHKDYTPGGSTGGEAALLACGASVLGWGTDIGGSVRIPSHMMGIYGLKPTSSRLPYRGAAVSTEGQEHVPSAIGPMASSLDTIHLATKSLIEMSPWEWDARCAIVPWRESMYTETLGRPLTIGVLLDDGVVRPHPPISRVLQSAIESLRAAGHDIVEWNADLHPECVQVMDQYYSADGCEDIRRDVEAGGEPMIPHVEKLVNRGEAISVYNYWQLNKQKWELQQMYLEKWQTIKSPKTGRTVDVVLMPPMPHTAVPHTGCGWVGYTKVWNFLDYPAMVLPGGAVGAEDVDQPWDFEPRGPADEKNLGIWKERAAEMASLRLPVGVQIVGRKLEEERVLAAAKVVDEVLRGKK